MSTKDEVFNYVVNTPENTNPAVLKSMLNNLEGGSSGGGLVVHETVTEDAVYTYHTLDKTFREIVDAAPLVFLYSESVISPGMTVIDALYSFPNELGESLIVQFGGGDYVADNQDSYPVWADLKPAP